jgi:hypothetical protein
MDPIRNRTAGRLAVAVDAWHRQARRLAGGDACPGWVPAGFPACSGRRAHVRDRNPSPVGRIPLAHEEELKRDRMGTESEPRSVRIEPNGARLGAE